MTFVSEVISITFTGLFVVFIALILLITFIWLIGKINSNMLKKKEQKKDAKNNIKSTYTQKDLKNKTIDSSVLDKKTIAAITAAIVNYRGGDSSFKIRSIKPNNINIAWKIVGLAENTRQF